MPVIAHIDPCPFLTLVASSVLNIMEKQNKKGQGENVEC